MHQKMWRNRKYYKYALSEEQPQLWYLQHWLQLSSSY